VPCSGWGGDRGRNPGATLAAFVGWPLREAGNGAIGMVTRPTMRGALGDKLEELYRFYHVPASCTAVGHIILEAP
jgi:hypothetical protein